jgi:hypothetical protein
MEEAYQAQLVTKCYFISQQRCNREVSPVLHLLYVLFNTLLLCHLLANANGHAAWVCGRSVSWDCGFGSLPVGMDVLSVVSVVCCQVEISRVGPITCPSVVCLSVIVKPG